MTVRYDPIDYDGLSAMMEEHEIGDYVTFDDYDKLKEMYETLLNRWNHVEGMIYDLYKEI